MGVLLSPKSLLNSWVLNLNKITEECNDIETTKLKENNLSDKFFSIVENNKMLQNIFFEYRNLLGNYIECIDLDCDLFFYNEHKKNRNLYLEHFKHYKSLKNQIF
jgi:hypothetical protein